MQKTLNYSTYLLAIFPLLKLELVLVRLTLLEPITTTADQRHQDQRQRQPTTRQRRTPRHLKVATAKPEADATKD
ncbi:unnamed protein product [Nezara viridula]|uniref:Uncharacterized protein n=1 Tax=Nezara viridula TaxID=85310 RepID=A0A9P0MZ34_NEZVI|nr:unnamed protein product [Nezara viridula]